MRSACAWPRLCLLQAWPHSQHHADQPQAQLWKPISIPRNRARTGKLAQHTILLALGSSLSKLSWPPAARRCVQRSDQPVILTGYAALNKLLGREVYTSHMQVRELTPMQWP